MKDLKKNKKINNFIFNKDIFDRDEDSEKLKNLFNKNVKCVLIKNPQDCHYGITTFLQKVANTSEYKVYFIDIKENSDIVLAIYRMYVDEFKQSHSGILLKIINLLLPVLCIFAPIKCSNLGFMLEGISKEALHMANDCPESPRRLKDAVLGIVERKSKKEAITFIFDNAQYSNDSFVCFANDLLSISNVRIVMGANEGEKIQSLTAIRGFDIHSENNVIEMNPFNMIILDGILKSHDNSNNLSIEYKNNYLKKTKSISDLYDIFFCEGNAPKFKQLSNAQIELIKIIKYCPFKLTNNEIIEILRAKGIYLNQEIIQQLYKNGILFNTGTLTLDKVYENQFNDCPDIYLSYIFDYFYKVYRENKYNINYDTLLFIVEQLQENPHYNCDCKYIAQKDLLHRSLINYFTLPYRILNDMLFKDDKSNLMLCIALYNQRKFKESREIMNNIKTQDNAYIIMDTLLLTYERKYVNQGAGSYSAKNTLEKLLSESDKKELEAILKAVYATVLLHSDDMVTFDSFVENNKESLIGKIGAGYFFRNIGFSCSDNNVKYFEIAKNLFKSSNDCFGYYTTQSNYLTYRFIHGDMSDEIIDGLLDAADKIIQFGLHNMHIVYNNIALFYLMRNNSYDLEQAQIYADKAGVFAGVGMPFLFVNINKALIHMLENEGKDAHNIINEIMPYIDNPDFKRVQQKYYLVKAFVEKANNIPASLSLEKAKLFPERRSPELTEQKIKKIEEAGSIDFSSLNIQDYIFPCYLEYWYFNPLKFIDI